MTPGREGEIPGRFMEEPSMVFGWLLGGCIEGVDTSNLRKLWRISGIAISKMYRNAIRNRD